MRPGSRLRGRIEQAEPGEVDEVTIGKVAVLTSGGDAPGMNAAIRSVVRTAAAAGVETVGIRSGYRGLMAADTVPLDLRSVGGIIARGGTILGSARALDFHTPAGQEYAVGVLRDLGAGGLIVIGGNGSQSGALTLHRAGFPTVGVASTIDNDLGGVDTSIGVDTALNTAVELVDRLRDTASSHHRAFVVEVMGRNSGYIALMTGIAGGAELILTPEAPISIDRATQALRDAYAAGKSHFIVVVAEGSPLKATALLEHLSQHPEFEARLSILGHLQRGGAPLVFDRLLATRTAAAATEALLAGQSGVMAGLVKGRIELVSIETAIQPVSKVTPELCALADSLAR
jgi:6-phosphofructokinase 1